MATTALHDSPTARVAGTRWNEVFTRVSWGAVLAGLVISIALQITLTLLGAAIGFTALGGDNNATAFGIGAALWAIAVPLVTLFVGGATTGHFANARNKGDAFVHGALLWGLSLVVATWLLGTAASRVIGGTIGLVGNVTGGAVSAVSQAAGSVASRPDVDTDVLAQARQRIEDEARARGLTEEQVQAEVARVQQQAANVADRAQDTAAGSAWLALLALGLSLGAAVFGAMRGARDHVTIDPDIAAARAGYSSGHAHTTT